MHIPRPNLYQSYRRIVSKRPARIALALSLIAAGMLLPMVLVPFEDFRFSDEPYQAYCCEHYERAFLGMLSFWIGNIWMKIFGQTYIALRYLMTLCYIATAAIGCIYVRKRGFSLLQTSIIFTLSSLGLVFSYLPLYGWDAGAYPFTALVLLIVLLYIDSPKRKYSFLLGAACGLMTLSRIPLVALVPIVLTIIVVADYKSGFRKKSIAIELARFAATYLATILTMTTIMVGSPLNYLNAFIPENTVAAHSFSDYGWVVDRCVKHAYELYPWLLPGCVAILFSAYFTKSKGTPIWLSVVTIAVLYYTVKAAFYSANPGRALFWQNHGIVIPEAFITILFAPLYANITKSKVRYNRLALAALIIFGLMQAFGSNSATTRVGWSLSMVFAFGVNSDAFFKARKFTFYFLVFSTITTGMLFCFKARGLILQWNATVNLNYATVFNGTKVYNNDMAIVEAIDSMKFIKSRAEASGMRTIAVGAESNCYNFPFGEVGQNSGMKFDVSSDDVVNDYIKLNADRISDLVFELCVTPDSALQATAQADGYVIYKQTHFPQITIYAKKELMGRLPEDPFREWGYEGPGE